MKKQTHFKVIKVKVEKSRFFYGNSNGLLANKKAKLEIKIKNLSKIKYNRKEKIFFEIIINGRNKIDLHSNALLFSFLLCINRERSAATSVTVKLKIRHKHHFKFLCDEIIVNIISKYH